MPIATTCTHDIRSPRWHGDPVTVVVISDLHVIHPWHTLGALARTVETVNTLRPDIILIPGDFLAEGKLLGCPAKPAEITAALAHLKAPLGVHATLGNHDWKDCPLARATGNTRNSMAEALAQSPITLHMNAAVDLGPFWLAGVDSHVSAGTSRRPIPRDDLPAALAEVPRGADTILMAHEPDLWVQQQPDVALTVSGHSHGGQIVLGNWRPLTPSKFAGRYAHGVFWQDDRALVVSGGLGYSGVPLRLGVPPEITMIKISAA